MPTPEDVALIDGTSRLISTGANIYAQGRLNKKTREWNEQQYAKQRADSLADWNMQNEYNSPTSQMARLREAGLNPNLVYGKGADNTAQAVRSADTGNWNPQRADVELPQLSSYLDAQVKQQTIDNLKAQNTVQTQEALLKAATTANVVASTETNKFQLGQAQSLSQFTLEAAKENVRKLKADVDYTLHQDERAAAQNAISLKQAAENILNLRAQRTNTQADYTRIVEQARSLKNDNNLKELDYQMKKMGIQPNDNIFMRVLGRVLNGDINIKLPSLKQFKKGGDLSFNKVFGIEGP